MTCLRIASAAAALCAAFVWPGDLHRRALAQGTAGAERATELLSVDFVAVGDDGSPIADLKPSDVTVRINGRKRTLRSLHLVEAAPRGAGAGPDPALPLPPPFGSNDVSSTGRTFYLVLDNDSFRPGRERPLREAVDRFLNGLSPHDRLSLVTMPYGGVEVPLTLDHARIRASLSNIIGHAAANETGSELACRSRRTLESLVGLLDTFAANDEPKTVIFVSAGLAAPRRDNLQMLAPGMCELQANLFQQVGTAAGAARAQFYMVMPEDVIPRAQASRENIAGVGFTGSDNPFEGLEHLAGVTGAHRMNLTGLPETALGRIARETSAYYVASFAPEGIDRSGRTQQLSVRVDRPNVVVRARPEITFAKADPRHAATTVREMVLSGRPFRDLQLRASAYASREGDGDKIRVMALVEPVDPSAKIATMGIVVFDEKNTAVAQWTGSGADITSLPAMAGMIVPAGLYRFRVGAIDDTGRGGTVDAEVPAELTPAGQLKLSSLLLGLSREGGFTPRLQFGGEPVAIAYVEIYGGIPGMPIIAALEVARTLNGLAIATVPLAIKPGDNRYLATGAVPLGALAPGDYAVRAIVGVEGQPAGRVTRTLRKAR